MALTLKELVTLAQARSDLHTRVAGACLRKSWAIFLEDPATPLHVERLAWAKNILKTKEGMMESATEMMLFFLYDATIQTKGVDATDIEIEVAVDLVLDFVVGV